MGLCGRPRERVDISPHLGGKRRDSQVGWVEGNRTRVYNLLNLCWGGAIPDKHGCLQPRNPLPSEGAEDREVSI